MKFARFQSVKNKASSKRFNICRASFPTTFLLASKVRRGLEAKNALVAAPCINRSSDISCGDLTNNAPNLRKISNNQKEKQTNIDIIQEKHAPNKIFLSRYVTALTIIYQVQQIKQELWFTNNGMTSSVTLHDSFAYPSSIRIIPRHPTPPFSHTEEGGDDGFGKYFGVGFYWFVVCFYDCAPRFLHFML